MTTQNLATVLAAARHRRAPHMWPPPKQQTLKEDPIIDGTRVRPYVLPENERARVLRSNLASTRRSPDVEA